MGPGRLLTSVADEYAEMHQNAPTQSIHTLKRWSQRYSWPERAASYDVELEAQKNAQAEAIMQEGLALAHNRVDKLKDLAGLLWSEMHERGEDDTLHNLWVPDVKNIGGVAVDIEHFNAGIIREYRDSLDDIAKETGGRVKIQEVTGKGGGPIETKSETTVAVNHGDELREFIRALHDSGLAEIDDDEVHPAQANT